MLDYEILNYKVQFIPKDDDISFEHLTDTKESAISFIKENRYKYAYQTKELRDAPLGASRSKCFVRSNDYLAFLYVKR